MNTVTVARPSPKELPDELKQLPVNLDSATIVRAEFMVALRGYARRNGWKIKTRRADLLSESFGVWRVS